MGKKNGLHLTSNATHKFFEFGDPKNKNHVVASLYSVVWFPRGRPKLFLISYIYIYMLSMTLIIGRQQLVDYLYLW